MSGQCPEAANGRSSESGIMVLKQKTSPRKGAPNRCYHAITLTASKSAFDDHRLVANAGLLLPSHLGPAPRSFPTGTAAPGPRRDAPGRANTGDKIMTLVASALAGGDCIDDADALRAGGTARVFSTALAQGSLHPGHLPAQLQVGPCPPTGPGEPRVAGPGLGGWGRTRRRTLDYRPGLHHLRDLRTGQGRAHATTATPVRVAITRCWPSPPEPAMC